MEDAVPPPESSSPAAEPGGPESVDRFGAKIRQLRTGRSWSLEQLAAASGVSRSMLSQIERQEANPTLAVAVRIARALGTPLAELLESSSPEPAIEVIRADDHSFHYRSDEQVRIRTLSPLHLEKDVEFYEVSLKPRAALESAAHYRGTREFLTVQQGKIRVRSGADEVVLATGDSANYRADVQHVIENLTPREARLFLVVIYV